MSKKGQRREVRVGDRVIYSRDGKVGRGVLMKRDRYDYSIRDDRGFKTTISPGSWRHHDKISRE